MPLIGRGTSISWKLVELDLWGSFARISGRPFSERIQKPMSSWVLASTGGSEMQSGTSF